MSRPSMTRRGLVTAAGATLLAGCSGTNTSETKPIDLFRIQQNILKDTNDPIVSDSLPIDIEASKLRAAATRVDDLLAELPLPFGSENIPNGHIRRELTDAASDATDHVEKARSAPNPFIALSELRYARSDARYAAAGWAFVDRDLTVAELRSDHQTVINEADSFHSTFEHLGADPVTAALVYGEVERLLESARNSGNAPARSESSDLLTVAEWGERVESTRSEFHDAQYLYDRFQSGLSEDVSSVDDTLSTAVETLRADLQQRRRELPPEPEADDSQVLWRLRDEMWRDAAHSVERVDDALGPASGYLSATGGVAAFLAHDRLADRLDDGETFRAEAAADVYDARTAAVEAITAAREQSPRPEFARPLLAEAAQSVSVADEQLRNMNRNVRPGRLDHPILEYTTAMLQAQSVPPACEIALDALDI